MGAVALQKKFRLRHRDEKKKKQHMLQFDQIHRFLESKGILGHFSKQEWDITHTGVEIEMSRIYRRAILKFEFYLLKDLTG